MGPRLLQKLSAETTFPTELNSNTIDMIQLNVSSSEFSTNVTMNYALQKGATVLVWQTPKIPVGKEFDLEEDPFELVARINEWVHAVLSLVILILLLYRTRHLDLLRLLFGFLIRCSFLSFSIIPHSILLGIEHNYQIKHQIVLD